MVLIRPATSDDWPTVDALIRHTAAEASPLPVEDYPDDLLARTDPADVLVAATDDRVVGFVKLGRPTSMARFQPNAAGMTWNRSSAATPTVVHSHMTAFATVANIASGTGAPGFSSFHSRIATSISRHQIHEATTTITSPI